MNIETAVAHVLGDKLANAIILDQGIHWAVVAAMAACKISHGPKVKAAIDQWVTEQKADAP